MVTKGEESRSFISEKIFWGEREAGAGGSNRFAKSVCEAAFAATCFSCCWCITNFPDFKLVLTGRKLTQNCVFPICVDLFPMFAPFPPFQPSSWLSVDQSCSTGPNNVATILSPQQRNEPKGWTWIKFNQFILTIKHVSPLCPYMCQLDPLSKCCGFRTP